VSAALDLARSYGIAIRFAELGDWGDCELLSEYDPAGPEIRINAEVAAKLSRHELETFVALAAGHELYHHREWIGEVPSLPDRAMRESAAARFARELLERAR
jgi:hypothetical protein